MSGPKTNPTIASSRPAAKITITIWLPSAASPASGKECASPQDAGQQGGHADHGSHHEQETNVVVLDVAHLVAGYAFELLAFMIASRSRGEGDGRLFRADPGGKGVGRRVVDHIDRGLGIPSPMASASTRLCSCWNCVGSAGHAPETRSTSPAPAFRE